MANSASGKSSKRIGSYSIASLATSIICCAGCSIHEHNRWGHPEDGITYLFAGGAYISFTMFVILGIVFVILLVKEN